ncbi:hypothetical protein V3C99_005670 [Haemonchus contortus]|nr:unnamed protein product [Haemonchus contortus]
MWLPLSTLFLFFSIARIAESKPDASTEIAFADTRGNDVDDEDDVQDPASRKLDVVPENPLPGMMSLGDGSLQGEEERVFKVILFTSVKDYSREFDEVLVGSRHVCSTSLFFHYKTQNRSPK